MIEASTAAAGVIHNFTAITDLLTDWIPIEWLYLFLELRYLIQ